MARVVGGETGALNLLLSPDILEVYSFALVMGPSAFFQRTWNIGHINIFGSSEQSLLKLIVLILHSFWDNS